MSENNTKSIQHTTENGKEFAKRLMDTKYGKGTWNIKSSEYSQIKKWGDRGFKIIWIL